MTPGDAKPTRHVGRITDPSVRDDGENEPELLPDAAPSAAGDVPAPSNPEGAASEHHALAQSTAAHAANHDDHAAAATTTSVDDLAPAIAEPTPTSTPEFVRTGHPVRDRLLAKAAEAQAQQAVESAKASEPQLSRFGSLDGLSEELDEIAAPRSAGMPGPVRIAGTALSSTSWTVFGTLIGLSFIASLFTLLVQFKPKDGPPPTISEGLNQADTLTVATSEAIVIPDVPPPPARKRLKGPWRIERAGTGEKLIKGTIGKDPFLRAIQAAGIAKTQAYRIHQSLKEEKNLDRCRPKDSFIALLEVPSGVVKAFEYIESAEDVYQAKTNKEGLLVGKKLDLKVRKQRVQGSILLTSASFSEAAVRAHFDPGLARIVDRALEGHTSVAEFKKGDRLRIVVQEVTILGEFSRYAGIEALEYLPRSGAPIRVYYFPQKKDYYDARGRAPGEGGWRRPVKGAPITSKFNPNRMHPILKKRMPHTGTDFGAPTGTPIYAASSGKISKRGLYGPNGNFISIEHAGGYTTGYSHLSRFEEGLKVGDTVKREQVIGYVGTTGRSTGPHLHFSARKNGQYIDAETLGLDALTVLPKAEREIFNQVRKQYDALLDALTLPPSLAVEPEPVAASNSAAVAGPEFSDPELGEPRASAPVAIATGQVQAAPAAQAAAASPSAAEATAPQNTVPASSPASGKFGSLYLSDKELLESQSTSSDGEVEE